MECIKETELNLQREVVTTVPNTWLVEAVNPSTGAKKMIDIANYASVVAGLSNTNFGYNTLAELASGIGSVNKAKITSTSVSVDAGEEGSLSLIDSTGLLVISNSYLTRDYDVAIFSTGTQAFPIVASENNNINYGSSISGKLCFYRESNNAALIIKNNSSRRAVLTCLCIRPVS